MFIETRLRLSRLAGQLPGPGGSVDLLIDSAGRTFSVKECHGEFEILPTGNRCNLEDLLEWVRDHAAQEGACCAAKLYAPSIPEAMAIVASLERG